jgi:hypothetical protein
MAKFYHEPNRRFVAHNPSVAEIERQAYAEQESARRDRQLAHRGREKNILQDRKIARQLLQFASLQRVRPSAETEFAATLSSRNPQLATEFRQRKSLTFKDPSKIDLQNSVTSYTIKSLELPILLQ